MTPRRDDDASTNAFFDWQAREDELGPEPLPVEAWRGIGSALMLTVLGAAFAYLILWPMVQIFMVLAKLP